MPRATTRLIEEVRATLAADPTNAAAIRTLVRLETIPALEVELAAEQSQPQPDLNRIAALVEEIRALHRGDPIPDHTRDALLRSVRADALTAEIRQLHRDAQ
jgi:hypothetical protein